MDICLHDVSKSYGDVSVLRAFSAQLVAGNRYAIVGPSGCGKTTLLRLLMGLETPDAGEISGCSAPQAAVFQDNRLFEALSVLSNLKAVLPRGTAPAVLTQALRQLGLDLPPRTPVYTLSGGMKRRVALARAMLAEAQLVLLDEPFTGLDEDTRRLALDFVHRHSIGKTLLVVTHEEQDAAALQAQLLRLTPNGFA